MSDPYQELQDSEALATRLENLLDVVTALAELDFSKRAEIHGDGVFLDGLAYGLNVLNEELRASTVSRDYYDGIIRSMAEGLLVVDSHDTISDVNPSLCRLLGYTYEELIGQPWSTICGHPRRELPSSQVREPDDERPAAGPQWRVETELRRADGEPVEVALSGSVLHRPDDTDDWMFVVQDITSQKELARNLANARDVAVHSAQVTASFLANMSHEIRTPLNGVIGMAWLLLEDGGRRDVDPATLSKIETIHDCATLLLDIVNDILDLSKLESGSVELAEEELDPISMVEDLLHVYAVRAEHKNLELLAELPPELPTRIRGDVGSLRQVLGNLVSNAIKFTGRGEVVVRVRLVEPSGATRGPDATPPERGEVARLRFEVRDTGIGIPEHLQSAIFQPFQQAETATARKYGGTGLGLTICRRLVELMGGLIGCSSVPGRGATFWFELPCRVVSGPRPCEEVRVLDGQRILVVDDNERVRQLLGESIERWGGVPVLAEDGSEAQARLEALGQPPPRLALIDWPSTTIAGTRLLGELAGQSGGNMEIVLLTSLSSTPPLTELRSLGVVRAVPKPLKLSRLRNLMRACIEGTDEPVGERAAAIGPRLTSDLPLLVVEDNPVNQAVVLGQLGRMGLTAQVVSNGREAVRAVAERRFSVVLMDLYMPEMDGYEATERIREHEHGFDLPIVAVTANATEQVRKRCLAMGMDDFLSKPLRIEQLFRSLSRWLVLRPDEPVPRPRESTVEARLRAREGDGAATASPPVLTSVRGEKAESVLTPVRGDRPALRLEPARDEPASQDPAAEDRSVFTAGARVLVVDDDAVNRRVLLGMLERLGIAADDVRSGAQAIVAASERRYDAVLMDVEMAGIDGLAATRMIRGAETTGRTPILAVTAHDDPPERARCTTADMDDFLSKPTRMIDLIARMTLWLGLEHRPDPRSATRGVQGTMPVEVFEALTPVLPPGGSLLDVREQVVRAIRECVRRLQSLYGVASSLDWRRDLFALVTWTSSVGAWRLASLATTLERCRADERRVLLDLLDREIADLAH